ncbi:MAG: ATP-binding protein [Spirochaetes bacterium]|nr:ATP-binding protein [Spirochaetota bacterium]
MLNDIQHLILRPNYLNVLKGFKDKPLIKVLIGMRRVGKSSILKIFIRDLLNESIPKSNIIYINKESLEFDSIQNYKDLYLYIVEKLRAIQTKKYVIIDEIQEIDQWEKAVNSLLAEKIADIYITGSNAKIMSNELSTLLSGRYVEIPVYPLTFKEFLDFRNDYSNVENEFLIYTRFGGLPGIHNLSFEDEYVFSYLNSIINTIVYKDIVVRNNIRETRILDNIIRYLFDNIGNITTSKKIANYFKSQRIKISVDTVINYFKYIESAMLIHRVERYDIKGKKYLEFYDKIYLNDIGLRNGLIGYKEKDISFLLENIVYNELRAKGYKISAGVFDNIEIDFIAEKQKEKKYIQVCYLLKDEDTILREFGNLEKIKDNYEKIVISMDKFFPQERNGIKHIYLLDFLLDRY